MVQLKVYHTIKIIKRVVDLYSEPNKKTYRVKAIVIEDIDNVATVLDIVKKEDIVDICNKKNEIMYQIKALEYIPKGNKIALKEFKVNDSVIKYKSVIGKTTRKIKKGMLIHVHNIKSLVIDTPSSTICEVLKTMELYNKLEEIDG